MIEISEIEERLDDIVDIGTFGPNFSFRSQQRETILQIADAYLNNKTKNIILAGPTGVGKSVIAIVTSKLLESFDNKGYVITSDILLQKQYDLDFKRMNLKYGTIMGVDNYICEVNRLKFSLGECRMRNIGYEKAKSLSCYQKCGYLKAREKSLRSSVSLLNYAYWLIQRNYVAANVDAKESFGKRDFVFFDECHKIPDIVQSHFSPLIDFKIIETVKSLHEALLSNRFRIDDTCDSGKLFVSIELLIKSEDKQIQLNELKFMESFLSTYVDKGEEVKDRIKSLFTFEEPPTSEWKKMSAQIDHLKDIHCKVQDYVRIIDKVGLTKLVKIKNSEESATYKCLEERYLIKKYLLDQANFKVFMSATIGNPLTYMKNLGIDNAQSINLENGFNYDKSPIYFFTKYKLTFKEKKESLPKVIKIIDGVVSKFHKDEKGIIHTGSYEFNEAVLKGSANRSRLIHYKDSKQKDEALKKFHSTKNGILIGPSIIEGLDLKGEMSRFQIFLKVPYPNIADPFIKAKLDESQLWYNYKTFIQIMQGIGRSIRSETDWAVTYMIDASFFDFYAKNKAMFTECFNNRVKILK